VWARSLWVLILIPFILDIYITKFLPWGFWKHSKSNAVRKTMEWVDAIIFALIAVYFINTFFFQNYQIPTSSLEKSLLVGDFLAVSKLSYGPRSPHPPRSRSHWHNTPCRWWGASRISKNRNGSTGD